MSASALISALERGEIDEAAELYEQSGRAVADQLMGALQRGDRRLREAGVRMYVKARDFARAARIHEEQRFWPDAAKMYEEGGDAISAARCWRKAGEPRRAARALDGAGVVDEAAALYEELGDGDARAACLARAERWVEAAAAYRQAGNARAETDALRQVPLDQPDRVPAVKRLAEILVKRNRIADAAQLVADALRDNDAGRTDIELHELLAALFDQSGQSGHADRLRLRAQRLRSRAGIPPAEVPAPAAVAPEQDGYRFLKQIPIFGRLTLGDMRDLHRLTTEATWPPGENILEVGVDPPGLIVIVEGDAEVYALSGEGARHLNSLGPGAHLGEISLVSNALTSARVTATTLVRGLCISREQLEMYLESHKEAALRIYKLFCEGLAERVRALSWRP